MEEFDEPRDPPGSLLLKGRLLDELDQPVCGARVWLSPGERNVTSDVNGAFAIDQLSARMYRVWARKEDLSAEIMLVRVRDDRAPVVLRMFRGTTLLVHVLADGAPLPGARVIRDDEVAAVTSPDGVATVRGIGSGF